MADELNAVLTELRDLAHGLHPAALTKGGLPPVTSPPGVGTTVEAVLPRTPQIATAAGQA